VLSSFQDFSQHLSIFIDLRKKKKKKPKKSHQMSSSSESEIELLLKNVYHLTDEKVSETIVNKKLVDKMQSVASAANVSTKDSVPKSVGVLLYSLSTALPPRLAPFCDLLAVYIGNERLDAIRWPLALDYIKKLVGKKGDPVALFEAFDAAKFDVACGVGEPDVGDDVVRAELAKLLDSKRADLEVRRYRVRGQLLGAVRRIGALRLAAGARVVELLGEALLERLGEETEADRKPLPKKTKAKATPAAAAAAAAASSDAAAEADEPEDTVAANVEYPPPDENLQKTPEILARHLAETGGQVRTRFPPEPNGFLHLGHVKAANLDFGYAQRKGGICFLRFDDTNPEAEKHEYVESIVADIGWLGFSPHAVTYSSDYFDVLYELAEKLVSRDLGYACVCQPERIAALRKSKEACECRSRPTDESLSMFRAMRGGKYKEGEVCVRMKCDMQSPNPVMRDMIAYRIKFKSHARTGDTWCIYPSYDFTHCICDSLENITHSLCSLEFTPRRESYVWLCEALDLYTPPQREFSRLNLANTLLSKRKLLKLIESGVVEGWDDPRMPTIMGARRRGFTPKALTAFCSRLSITRTENIVEWSLLNVCLREALEDSVPRAFAVLDPLHVVIDNVADGFCERREAPNHPSDASFGVRQLPLTKHVYIERKDFRRVDAKQYFGLAPGKIVRLRYGPFVECVSIENAAADADGVECPAAVHVRIVEPPEGTRVRGILHWVANPTPGTEPPAVEVRLYEPLFKSRDPAALGDTWFDDINENALVVKPRAFVDPTLVDAKPGSSWQFERLGFFYRDHTIADRIVFNRTVSLRDNFKGGKSKK
jgi:glutaminyl-tRNA synthetase